eukprot:s2155_g3.t1
MGLSCKGGSVCDRTGLKRLKWRPTTSGGKVVQFTTGDEREYPSGFCAAYARCAAKILGSKGTFVEVFSGPNAPLTRAMCQQLGEELRGTRLRTEKGLKVELQRLSQVMDASNLIPASRGLEMNAKDRIGNSTAVRGRIPDVGQTPEALTNRLAMLEANRQPSYGKRGQLIPDGLSSQRDHLERALRLTHPFDTLQVLKVDHLQILEQQTISEKDLNLLRLRVLADWRTLSSSEEVRKLQDRHEGLACENAKRLGRKPRTALMEILGERYNLEDAAVPKLCLTGMPIVGAALEPPFFDPHEIPPTITIAELLASAPSRRQEVLRRVEFMSKKAGESQAKAILQKTLKEVQQGSMGGPFSHEELLERHGRFYNVIPSFGLEQGVNERNEPKFRRINDHSAGFTNLAAHRKQKISMAMVDYLIVMIKALFQKVNTSLEIGTEDMRGAYRQIPLVDSQTAISITAIYNPYNGKVQLYEMYGQPFGAGHSVPFFYRVAEWACRLIVRGFKLMLDHFFDDYYYVERPGCSKVGMFCLQQAFGLMGLELDDEKSQPPAEVAHVLGVAFNTQSLLAQRTLRIEPKPLRVQNFVSLVNNILERRQLPASVAASVLGKFGFLCSTLFGKLGRFCTGALRERQYSQGTTDDITPHLAISLRMMQHIVQIAPPRLASFKQQRAPAILYTDASDVPARDPRYGLGGVLILQSPKFHMEFFSCSVPANIHELWTPKENYMTPLETLAAPTALRTWSHLLCGQQLLHFIDNDSAASNLVKGYSSKSDTSPLIGDYWIVAATHSIDTYIDRVESKSNVADGPSRFDNSFLDAWPHKRDGHYFAAAFRWPGGCSQPGRSVSMPEGLSEEAMMALLRLRYGADELEAEFTLEVRHFAELLDWPNVRKRCEAHLEALLQQSKDVDGASLLAVVSHAEESSLMPPHLKAAALAAAVRQWSRVAEAAASCPSDLSSTRQAELGALNRVRHRDGHVCGSLEEYLHAAVDDLTDWERNMPLDAPQSTKKKLEGSWQHWHQILFEYGHIFGAENAEKLRDRVRTRRRELLEDRKRQRGEALRLPEGKVWFEATAEWQEVPPNGICAAGLEYRLDMQTGRNFARLAM